MRPVSLIVVPYHMGQRSAGVGAGPERLVAAGIADVVGAARPELVEFRDDFLAGLDAVVEVNRCLSEFVRASVTDGRLPVVLAGNCNSCLGTLAGIGCAKTGVVWLDAHGDFHTPETSASGFLDGMALAAAVGDCHRELALACGLKQPVAASDVVLLAARDLEASEEERLGRGGVTFRSSADLGDADALLEQLSRRVDGVYLHVDLDFLSSEESPGVNFHGPGGVSVEAAENLVASIAEAVPIAAVAFTNYNPARDPDGLTVSAALRLARALTKRNEGGAEE